MGYNNKKRKFVPPRDPNEPYTDLELKKMREKAKKLCFYYLNKSDKTRKELELRLKNQQILPEIIEETLNDMEERNYVNDQRLAEHFVQTRTEWGGLGKNAISMKLSQRGIDRNIIDEAISEVDVDKEFDKAKNLAKTRLRSTSKLESRKRYNTLVMYLMRRGFGGDVAYTAVSEAIAEEHDDFEESDD